MQAFIAFDWPIGKSEMEFVERSSNVEYRVCGNGVLEADVAQRLDQELRELSVIGKYFIMENVRVDPVGLKVAELRQKLQSKPHMAAADEKKARKKLEGILAEYTPLDAADFVMERLGAIPPDAYLDAVAQLDPCVRAMEDVRERQEEYHQKLLDLFSFAFEICDTGGDGEVSMEECVLLDSQIAQVVATEFDEEDCADTWRDMDATGDGTVSRDEYVSFQMRNFGPTGYEDACNGISYVLDVVDNMRSVPPCDGIITVTGAFLCFLNAIYVLFLYCFILLLC